MNKLATVDGFFEENKTPIIKFDGEEKASEKEYPYLGSYLPEKDDKVLCLEFGESYIILGCINFKTKPTDSFTFDTLTVNSLKATNIDSDVIRAINNSITSINDALNKAKTDLNAAITKETTDRQNAVNAIWRSVNSLISDVKKVKSDVTSISNKITPMEKSIKNLDYDVFNQNGKVGTLRSDYRKLESRVADLERKVK